MTDTELRELPQVEKDDKEEILKPNYCSKLTFLASTLPVTFIVASILSFCIN